MTTRSGEYLQEYAAHAPLALAIERSVECCILSKCDFPRPILDLGCGDGIFANILFEQKIDTGIDPNALEISHAQALDAYVELIQCYGDAIPRSSDTYGTIFSNSVLEHIPDLDPVLREAHRLLRPSGMLYVTVPSDQFERYAALSRILTFLRLVSLEERFRRFYNNFWAHHHCYAPQQWASRISGHGFEIVELRSYCPKNICTFNDLLAPFGAGSFVLKRTINKWTLVPGLRRVVLRPVINLLFRFIRHADRAENGGLVFIAARKV